MDLGFPEDEEEHHPEGKNMICLLRIFFSTGYSLHEII
jgi:hypothetical protein